MSVPFSNIGPGQVARLAWQIIGKRGPVFNPSGIRYLPPDALAATGTALHAGLFDAATALAGLNVLMSAGTLAMSAATLAEVKRVNAKVDSLLAGQAATHERLDMLLAKVERVTIKVSEARLAGLVHHALKGAALGDDEVSLRPFGDLAGDIQTFLEDAQIVRGWPASFRLGTDVRHNLQHTARLLQGVRIAIAREYNRLHDPASCWVCDPVADYWVDGDAVAAVYRDRLVVDQVRVWDVACFNAHTAVDQSFSLNSPEDHLKIQAGMNAALEGALQEHGIPETELAGFVSKAYDAALSEKGSGNPIPLLDRDFSNAFGESVLRAARDLRARYERELVYPPAFLDEALRVNDQDGATGEKLIDSYHQWWLYETDAGLVYRAFRECAGIRDGYGKAFGVESKSTAPQLDAPLPVEFQFDEFPAAGLP